MATTVEPVYIK